jgi:hypothetical protein
MNAETAPVKKQSAEYMREYKRTKYHEDIEGARAYRNSLRYKKRLDLPAEEFEKYGRHLADVVKLRQLAETIPTEFFREIVQPILYPPKTPIIIGEEIQPAL